MFDGYFPLFVTPGKVKMKSLRIWQSSIIYWNSIFCPKNSILRSFLVFQDHKSTLWYFRCFLSEEWWHEKFILTQFSTTSSLSLAFALQSKPNFVKGARKRKRGICQKELKKVFCFGFDWMKSQKSSRHGDLVIDTRKMIGERFISGISTIFAFHCSFSLPPFSLLFFLKPHYCLKGSRPLGTTRFCSW